MRDPLHGSAPLGDERRPIHVRGQAGALTHDPVADALELAGRIEREVAKQLVAQDELVRQVVTTLFAGGHCLVEGTPGLGKTLLVRTLGQVLGITFSRIQFTPDLMPTDIVGTNVYAAAFGEGGTRALRLEEGQVTIGQTTHKLPEPFFVLATQNPLEMEGTYPLPEVQLDRFFFKVSVDYPSADDLRRIVVATTSGERVVTEQIANAEDLLRARAVVRDLPIASYVQDYAARLVLATQPKDKSAPRLVRQYVTFGASPRGAQSLILAAKVRALLEQRYNVGFADIRAVALPALRHRIKRNLAGEVAGVSTDAIVKAVLEHVYEE
jgi:MoxR-like ATPase